MVGNYFRYNWYEKMELSDFKTTSYKLFGPRDLLLLRESMIFEISLGIVGIKKGFVSFYVF